MNKLYNNLLLTACSVAFYGALIYYFYQLNYVGLLLTLILSILSLIILNKKWKVKKFQITDLPCWQADFKLQISGIKKKGALFVIFYILVFISCLLIVINSTTTTSIISPWEVIPWYFWATYTLATTILIITIFNFKSLILNLFLISLHFLLSASAALIVYTVGFGFDPFIHEATEKLIATQGFVDPKPLYYLGQYALVVFVNKLFFVPISILNTWLVPVLASLFLPPALFNAIKNFGAENKPALLSTLFILISPFSFLTITTPQNLAYLFLLLLILISMYRQHNVLSLLSLSLAALAVHPIAGIPAILFVAMLWGKKLIKNKKLVTCHLSLVTCASALAIPVAFYFNNKTNTIINPEITANASPLFQMPKLFFSGPENFLLNFVYLYGFNIGIILIFFIIFGIWIARKQILNIQYSILNICLLMSISLLISFFITKFVSFSYLIDYEQSNFSNRILLIAIFFTLPFILITLFNLIAKILKQEKIVKYSLLTFLILIITASLYISYPRFDNYYNSRSYSTSQSDIDAVHWIENDAKNNNFIVLANQQVSAAALKEFGFKKYFKASSPLPEGEGLGVRASEIFYYPIPTGEKLYEYYLDMVYRNAEKKTALEAAALVGADTAYFVLNDYWFGFDKILAEASYEADEIKNIDNGQIYIFKYKK